MMGRLYFRLSLMREPAVLQANSAAFYGLALESHIIELYANAVATFLTQLRKPYFVDPVFYKFSAPIFSELSEKRWVDSLSSHYGIETLLFQFPEGFDVANLESVPNLSRIVASVLDYQRRRVPSLNAGALSLASLTGQVTAATGPPEFLVVPYLFVSERASIRSNLKLAREGARIKQKGERLYAVLALSRDYFGSESDLEYITREYAKVDLDGYLIWITDFKDWEEDSEVLKSFAGFVRRLSAASNGREVINLFGGYFSAVLAARGLLGGSAQGVGIAEFRDPLVTGGGFAKRYYVPISHRFVSVDLADDLRDANPSVFSCSCPECGTGTRPGSMSVQALAQHFVSVRTQEFQIAAGLSATAIADQLSRDRTTLARIKVPGIASLTSAHGRRLEVWEKSLRDLVQAGLVA